MTKKYQILFLGETYRADAITWMNGLKEFAPFEIHTWELTKTGTGIKKFARVAEMLTRLRELKKQVKGLKPDLIIAERVTSYGFIATLFHKYAPVVIAQQGITDIYPPGSITVPVKKWIQQYAFRHASLIHAWGVIMTHSMKERGADDDKILVLPKGIDLRHYQFQPRIEDEKLRAIVTRSLSPDYRHETIFRAFEILKQKQIPFELLIIGDGPLKDQLMQSAKDKGISEEIIFKGRIPNTALPQLLADSDLYVSMPCTEGVSASLFEAMAAGCYPLISDLPGNRAWVTSGKNGSLVKVDDVAGLAATLEWYYEHRQGLQHILHVNRQTITQYVSYEKNMQIICSKYLSLIKKAAPAG